MKTFCHTITLNVFTEAESEQEAEKQSEQITAALKIGETELDVTWIDTEVRESKE